MAETWSSEKIEKFAEQISEHSLHNRDQAITWRQWALASCLSVNAGAAIAVLNLKQNQIWDAARGWALFWFIAGIVASIIYGFVSAVVMSKFSGFYMKSSWVMKKRALPEGGSEKLNITRFDELLNLDRNAQWLQYISLVLFVLGLGVVAEGLK